MSYSYETRDDGVYLLTGKKTKDKNIVIKMGSNISETYLTDAITKTNYKLSWSINVDNLEDTNTINLKGKIDEIQHCIPMNATKVIDELSDMVIKNKTLEVCETLNNALNKGLNDIFKHMLNTENIFLCSTMPIEAYIILRHKGKMIGGASRFSFNSGILYVYEYVGKNIDRNMELTADVIIGDCKVIFNLNAQENELYEIYDSNTHTLGYFSYNAKIRNIVDNSEYEYIEIPEIAPLKVPKMFTNKHEMNSYIKKHNSLTDIDKYRISLKPKLEIININKFMLREFTV